MAITDLTQVAAPGLRHFGVAAALLDGYAALDTIATGLEAFRHRQQSTMPEPIRIDSPRLCLLAYGAALGAVRQRFWTTTYLSSGFWGSADAEVLDWNRDVARALAANGEAVRRLFLLTRSPEEEIRRWRDDYLLLRKYGDDAGARALDERLDTLLATVAALTALGCDVRVAHDSAQSHRALPSAWAIDGSDAEIAIYDEWRFDIFRGGSSGTVRSVDIHTPALCDFAASFAQASGYFDDLWGTATAATDFLQRIRAGLDAAAARIEYHPLWLARYDHDLSEADERLKHAEFAAVAQTLDARGTWGTIGRILDVGTCTARYPIALRAAVRPDGDILGVDYDWDAVRFARHNVRETCSGDARIRIEHADFCAEAFGFEGPFDVITCMLGTFMHFQRDPGGMAAGDDLQRALERFRGLLAPDGILFFTIWTEAARQARDLLSIYSDEDMRKLSGWNGTAVELEARLAAAGLDHAEAISIDGRMQLFCCRPAHQRFN